MKLRIGMDQIFNQRHATRSAQKIACPAKPIQLLIRRRGNFPHPAKRVDRGTLKTAHLGRAFAKRRGQVARMSIDAHLQVEIIRHSCYPLRVFVLFCYLCLALVLWPIVRLACAVALELTWLLLLALGHAIAALLGGLFVFAQSPRPSSVLRPL